MTGIVGYAETGDRRFISTKGDRAYVLVQLDATDEGSVELVDPIRAKIAAPAGYAYQLTGYGPITKDFGRPVREGPPARRDRLPAGRRDHPHPRLRLARRGRDAASGGGLAIPSTLGLIFFVSQQLQMSIYVLNIATMLGLALAIDYSLFIVSRFREELARGRTVGQAVEKAVATSGKAVTFSGLAVMIGLSGLLLFRASAISSIGIAGALVVVSTLFFALTFLPAVLGMLGHRVNALSLRGLFARLGVRPLGHGRAGWWERVARQVMRHPIAVLVPVLIFLFILGSPFFRLVQGVPDAAIYPAGLESRDAYVAIQTEFPQGETSPIVVLARVKGDPTDPANALALARYAEALGEVEGIDHVEGAYGLTDPETGAALTAEQVAALYALPAAQRPPEVAAAIDGAPEGLRPRATRPVRRDQPARPGARRRPRR